jgi:hypothetical protein
MNDEQENKDSYQKKNRYYYSRVYPAVWLIVIGFFFLLNNFGYLSGDVWGKLWPLFIIIPGVFMLLRPRRGD